MECTTTAAQTLTLTRIDCVAGDGITIFWGDGTSNSYTSANNGTTKTHAYSGAGTWNVKIANPLNFSLISLSDSKLTNFNSNQFLKCGDNLYFLNLTELGSNPTINSSHFAHLKLTTTLYLTFSSAGTYYINSEHFKNYTLNNTIQLCFYTQGTYIINTAHFKNYTVHFLYNLCFNTTNLTKTISRSDFTLYRVPTVTIHMGLTQAEVDAVLLGFYDAFPSKTNTGGTINLNGGGNAAPSGTYRAACPPMTGKEAAYELLNDSCNASDKHWATINVVGGSP